MNYDDLDKHFTAPKHHCKTTFFFGVKRVPRKFKKKWRHLLCGGWIEDLDIGQKLWYIQHLTNPNYNRFLIKKICEYYANIQPRTTQQPAKVFQPDVAVE